MRAAVYYNNKDVRIEEREIPKIGPKELLIKIHASGICGSDVLEWYRIKKAPLVLGHEIAGEVAKTGRDVKDYKVGDRIVATHHVPCNQCRYCLAGHHTTCELLHKTSFDPGGFSEFVRIPQVNIEKTGVLKLPDNVSYEEGTFIEPLGCVLRGQKIIGIKPGDTVLILGSGIAGLLHIKMARYYKADKIIATDITDYRMKMAEKFGADLAIDAKDLSTEKLREINTGRLADNVIVCAGALSAANQAFQSVDKGGTILIFAVPRPGEELLLPIQELWKKGISIKTSYAASPSDLKEALNLIQNSRIKVKDMITHRLKLGEIQRGFKLVAEAKESVKVIIYPNE